MVFVKGSAGASSSYSVFPGPGLNTDYNELCLWRTDHFPLLVFLMFDTSRLGKEGHPP